MFSLARTVARGAQLNGINTGTPEEGGGGEGVLARDRERDTLDEREFLGRGLEIYHSKLANPPDVYCRCWHHHARLLPQG